MREGRRATGDTQRCERGGGATDVRQRNGGKRHCRTPVLGVPSHTGCVPTAVLCGFLRTRAEQRFTRLSIRGVCTVTSCRSRSRRYLHWLLGHQHGDERRQRASTH